MSDEEIICAWMEPKPNILAGDCVGLPHQWWRRVGITSEVEPVRLTLDRLHEVEKRLTDAQWRHYCGLMFQHAKRPDANPIQDLTTATRKALLHATVAQKIKALAAVLRADT